MKIFKSSPCFSNSIEDSAKHAFGFCFSSGEIYITTHTWGCVAHVATGENAGTYDVEKEDGRFIFLEA